MTDPNAAEIAAMQHAGAMGGEYLESLGRTDLATLTPEEWHTFIAAVCGGYVDSLLRQHAEVQEAVNKAMAA